MTPRQAVSIAPPQPDLTPEEMLTCARAMVPHLRARQAHCEAIGRLPEDTNEQFLDAGFYRILQPRRFGGYEFSATDFVKVMIEISRGCAESGWVLALTAGHPAAFLAGFPEECQREIYGTSGDVRAPAVAMPGSMAVPVEGGFLVNGQWDYCSGCDVATHFLGGVLIIDPQTNQPGAWGAVVLDKNDYEVIDNWSVLGMQGTGSKRVLVKERIVPTYRVQAFTDPQMSRFLDQPARRLFSNPLFHGPLLPLLMCEATAVAVGAARGALDVFEEILRTKKSPAPPFSPWYQMVQHQQRFGYARGLIDTAEAALFSLASDYMQAGERALATGVVMDTEGQRRLQRVAQQCVQLAWDAVELIWRTAGTSSARKDAPLGRYFRNLAVLRTHVTMQIDVASINSGALHFGLNPLTPY